MIENKGMVFSGRLIFDHLPKTAGQSVNAWLQNVVGAGNVTNNLIGKHCDLIKEYGGNYSVISGHVHFSGESLDPRYKYVTLLREPLDRALSWIYFIANSHGPEDFKNRLGQERWWHEAVAFIESDGDLLGPGLRQTLTNPYVRHFSSISHANFDINFDYLEEAKKEILNYDLVGLMDDLPEFASSFLQLLNVSGGFELPFKNVTGNRPKVNNVSSKLRAAILNLIDIDLKFYNWIISSKRISNDIARSRDFSRVLKRKNLKSEFIKIINSPRLDKAITASHRDRIDLIVEFSTMQFYPCLIMQIYTADTNGEYYDGQRSNVIEITLKDLDVGIHSVAISLNAELPIGRHRLSLLISTLSSLDDVFSVEIGYCDSFAQLDITDNPNNFLANELLQLPIHNYIHRIAQLNTVVSERHGSIELVDNFYRIPIRNYLPNQKIIINIALNNDSFQFWQTSSAQSFSVLQTWRIKGDVIVALEEKTPFYRGLLPGERYEFLLEMHAPDRLGRYEVTISMIDDTKPWSEADEFSSLKFDANVIADQRSLTFLPNNPNIFTKIGVIQRGDLVGMGSEGYLFYGPYINLEPGKWKICVDGFFDPRNSRIYFDITTNKGKVRLAQLSITQVINSFEEVISLQTVAVDVEARVWCAADSCAIFRSLKFIRLAD